ncbi:Oxoglutarate/iron-dependent dioxygenase [Corchorus olitorius]|uniref:Oxoglutarate/iron-dependent dioxygenase n=1 Tax=Corchorus olitorius TaxID=93759 RepID=A0A1R3L4Y1_9ROSI|nr:Oxoglutarate/iron-dependent dioxygenase [Corchorus olitorius]
MEKVLLASRYKEHSKLPESYILPADRRPGKLDFPRCNSVPVIDLGNGDDPLEIVQRMLKACQEIGVFQVVNHGVSEEIINETRSMYKEFFEMPEEDKASLITEDHEKQCKLVTGSTRHNGNKLNLWRDNLKHPCHPLEECMKSWPEKPTRYREVVAAYSTEIKKLGSKILELLCQGLGIDDSSYFEGKLSEDLQMSVNYYPPCPDPSLTLGIPPHHDPTLITILHQGDVSGLQLLKDGEWFNVEAHPNAFVVNIGYQLQVISNNKLKSCEHRAVTNSIDTRITIVCFLYPASDSIIEPVASLVNESNPPLCRAFQSKEFMRNFYSMGGNGELALHPFK